MYDSHYHNRWPGMRRERPSLWPLLIVGAGMVVGMVALFLATTEPAAGFERPYWSVYGGAQIVPDQDVRVRNPEFEPPEDDEKVDAAKADAAPEIVAPAAAPRFLEFDDGSTGIRSGAAVGAYVAAPIRLEGEFSVGYNQLDIAGRNVDLWTPAIMGNVILELDNKTAFTPYAGFGVGLGFPTFGGNTDVSFAYQLLAGIGVDLSESMTVTVGYRYFGLTDGEFKRSEFRDGFDSHVAEVGVRFDF